MSRPPSRTALVLTPRLPWPLDDGGRIVLWQSLWSMAQGYRTILVTLEDEASHSRPLPDAIAGLGVEVVRILHRPPTLIRALALGTFGRWPYTLTRYRNRELDRTLRELVVDRRPAIAFVNHLHLATYADALLGTPWVLREHNVESSWMRRYAASRKQPWIRAYAQFQAGRLARAESSLCARASLVLAIQEEEAIELRRLAPGARVEMLPIGIDFARFLQPRPEMPPVVLIIGSFAWGPNLEGLVRFLAEGWPRLRTRCPGVRLRVVGKALPLDIAELLSAAGAEPVGFVEDVAPEFQRASVLLVPLWTGAGARVKIVEALAAGTPVVSTPLGAEGLGLSPGVHALLVDSPAGLADAAAELIERPEKGRRLAAEAHAHARREFSLQAVASRTLELCAGVERPADALPPPAGG
ncbi:MAG: glycosyltransferase family 4 protein [Candidatus Eisenbacteria bacterium]